MKTKAEIEASLPQLKDEHVQLLKRLSNASGVTWDEGEIRSMVLEQVKPLADDVKVDVMGSVIALKRGTGTDRLKVLVAAHMDEIGFVVTVDDGDGLYQFAIVGGVDVRQLPGKPVLIGKNRVPGVIGARAIHLTTAAQRKEAIPLETLRLDVGEGKVEVGDRVVFATEFWQTERSLFGKAMDDRVGVVTLIEMLKNNPDNIDLYAAFTVQEEIGLRGAQVAAYNIEPDIAIAIDATPAFDFPSEGEKENVTYRTRLGDGPAIYVMDGATLSDPRLVSHFVHAGNEYSIPFQLRQAGPGGTDAGAMHRQRAGIPSISISVPNRNAHTAIGVVYKEDWEHLLQLLHAGLSSINPGILAQER